MKDNRSGSTGPCALPSHPPALLFCAPVNIIDRIP
jgi:hypothetical protein